MSSKPLAPICYPFITLLWRDICDKMEQREWENEAECSCCGSRPWRYQLSLWFTPSWMRTWVFHPASPGERCSAMTERRVSETPWQVGRHKDSLMLIIDGNKLHSLDVWQGNTWWIWIQMCLWMWMCVYREKKKKARENGIKQKRRGLEKKRKWGGGEVANRVMVVIPDKDTLERDAEVVYKSKLLLNVSHTCDKNTELKLRMLAFPFAWTEQGDITLLYTNANRKMILWMPPPHRHTHTHTQTNILKKVSSFV